MKIFNKIQSRKFLVMLIACGIAVYNPAALTWPLVVIMGLYIGGTAIQNIAGIIRSASQLPPTQDNGPAGPDNGAVQ